MMLESRAEPTIFISVFGLLALLLLAVLVTIAIVAARRGGWGRLIAVLGGCFLVFFLLAATIFVPYVALRRQSYRVEAPTAAYRTETNTSRVFLFDSNEKTEPFSQGVTTIGGGSAWLPEVDKTLRAYIYPSSRSAAQALGREIAERLKEVIPDGSETTKIWLGGDNFQSLNGSMILADVAEVLRRNVKSADVVLNTAPNSQGPKSLEDHEVSVRVHVPRVKRLQPAKWDKSFMEQEAVIQAHVRGSKRGVSADVEFVEKPWVDRFDQFVSTRPQSNLIQARSGEFASSEHEARQQAITAAANSLAATIARTAPEQSLVMIADNRSIRAGHTADSVQQQQLSQILVYHLNTGRFIADRFPQRLQHRYDDMWREALLIEFGPRDAARVLHKLQGVQSDVRRYRFSQAGSLVGMLAFVCVGYLVLNAATKGYYRGLLITGCLIVAVLFVGALLFVG